MKKKVSSRLLRYICSLIAVLLLTGCASGNTNMSGDSPAGEERVEMTEEEKGLLKRAFLGVERIEDGELLSYEKSYLYHSRIAMEYLKEKYPSYEFVLINGEYVTKHKRMATFYFYERDKYSPDLTYHDLYLVDVHVDEEDEDKVNSITDNFVNHLIKDDYDAYIIKILKDDGIVCRKADVSIRAVFGEEYGETTTLEDILPLRVNIVVDFFFSADDLDGVNYEDFANKVEQVIRKNEIIGGYSVDIYEDEEYTNRAFHYWFRYK